MSERNYLGLFFRSIARAIDRLGFSLTAPAAPRVARTEQFYMAQTKHFRHILALPPVGPDDQDVTTRELTVEFGGRTWTITAGRDDAEARVEVPAGIPGRITLVDVDDSGNRSQASDPLDLDGSDTAPPARPGVMSVARSEQFFADDAGTAPTDGGAPAGGGTGPAPTDGGTPAPTDGGTSAPAGGGIPAPTDGGTPAPTGTDAGTVPAPNGTDAGTGPAPTGTDATGTAPATDAGLPPGTDPNAPAAAGSA